MAILGNYMPGVFRKIEICGGASASKARPPACRLLFVGGCHTVGHPFGIKYGFPHLALEQLQHHYPHLPLEAHVLAYMPLSRTTEILAGCHEVHPDILVLQLGHYETASTIKRRIRTLLHLPQPTLHSGAPGSSKSESPSPSESSSCVPAVRPSRWPTLKRIVKYWLDLALRAAGQPRADLTGVRRHSRELFAQIAPDGIPHVLVLSPFLALPAMVNHYRRAVGRILREEAAAVGFTYLDLDEVFGPALSRRRYDLHWDDTHLNLLGQQYVATRLAEALEKCLAGKLSTTPQPYMTMPSSPAVVAR